MTVHLLLSDDRVDCHCHSDSMMGCGCEFVGGQTGTVYAAYDSAWRAADGLAGIEGLKAAQRATLDEWGKRSWAENPVVYDPGIPDHTLRGMRAVGDRNARRAKWMEANPLPPMDLQHRFWTVAIQTIVPAPLRVDPDDRRLLPRDDEPDRRVSSAQTRWFKDHLSVAAMDTGSLGRVP